MAVKANVRTNAKAARCETCGVELKPGEGRLEFVPDASDNDDFERIGTDRERAHWEVFCLDHVACSARTAAVAERHAAERAEARRAREEAASVAAAEKAARQAEWEALTAGLVRTDAQPAGLVRTREYFAGLDVTCERITLPGGETGWHVSWVGDRDGQYWLVPASTKESAEAEKARLHRIQQWWRPGSYGPESYPGPGVPEDQLTDAERAEVSRLRAARYSTIEERERRYALDAVQSRSCAAWEALAALGAEIEIVIDPEALSAFSRARADAPAYSKERDALRLVVTLRAKLPACWRNKNGTIKEAVKRKLPQGQTKTGSRFVEVRVEVGA